MLCDEIDFKVKAGDGGSGVVHWRKEKYVDKGGPDGGDGGDGGDVIVKGVRDIMALASLYKDKIYKAQNGENGLGAKKSGKNGKDIEIAIPTGTVITNKDTGEVIEILKEGDRFIIAAGGEGGCLLYTSPSPRDRQKSRMPSSA